MYVDAAAGVHTMGRKARDAVTAASSDIFPPYSPGGATLFNSVGAYIGGRLRIGDAVCYLPAYCLVRSVLMQPSIMRNSVPSPGCTTGFTEH